MPRTHSPRGRGPGRSTVGAGVGASALVLSLMVAAGCARAAEPPSTQSGTIPGPAERLTYEGPVTSGSVGGPTGVSLEPPGEVVPAVPWTAVADACVSGDALCDPAGRGTVTLARATARQAGEARPDGSIAPLMDDRLVYVMRWPGVPCLPSGPPPARGTSPGPVNPRTCDLWDYLDADTGKIVYAVSHSVD